MFYSIESAYRTATISADRIRMLQAAIAPRVLQFFKKSGSGPCIFYTVRDTTRIYFRYGFTLDLRLT
jgi:hypothetical protein